MPRVTIDLFVAGTATVETIRSELLRKMDSNRLVYTIEPQDIYCVVYKEDPDDLFGKPQVFRTPAEDYLDAQNIFKSHYPETDVLYVEQCEDPLYAINRWETA